MAYIGNPVQQALTKVTSQSFNGTGSQTVFTLNRAVNTGEELEVFVNNVQQEPGVGKSYTATGTTLTFDAAPASGTGNIYVIYRGIAEVTRRLEHDPNAALAATTGTFSGDLTVDTNTLYVDSTNNRVGIGGVPSELLHIKNASGDAAVRIDGNTRTFNIQQNNYGLRFVDVDAGSVERLRIDAAGIVTMPYQPISHGRLITTFSFGNLDTLKFATVSVNNGGHYNTSTGIFTCPVSGYYQAHINALPRPSGTSSSYINLNLFKNGVDMTGTTGNAYISPIEEHEFGTTLIVYASANDTLAWVVGGDNTLSLYGGETSGGFQLIG